VQAIYGNPSHNYRVSLAVWDHTVLPSTRHKRTHPASTPARQAGTRFTDHLRMEGWVSPGPGCKEQLAQAHGCYVTARASETRTHERTLVEHANH